MKTVATKLLIVVLVAACGGFLGYLSQSGFADLFGTSASTHAARTQAFDQSQQPITAVEYRRKTEQGWWFGCGAGAMVGLLMVAGFGKARSKSL